MKAIIYCRVSSKEQEETGYSLDAQKAFLSEYAEKKGYEVAKHYKVTESASKWTLRKTLEEMLAYAEKHEVNTILVEKIDRLTRNMKDAVLADDWVRAKDGREFHFVKENFILNNKTKAHDNLVWDMKVAVARFYANNLSEEVRKGQAEKIAQGWLPTRPPLGYKTEGEKGHKIHVLDAENAPLVREMFELYSTGQYSLRKLCEVMKDKGLRSNLGHALVKSRMADLLSDPFYYGAMRWNDVVHFNGKHEPLISKSLFNEVQRIMHKGSAPLYSKHLHTFKGFIRCAECGGLITWEEKKGIMYGHCNSYRKCTKRPWYKETQIVAQISEALGKLVVKSKRVSEWLRDVLRESNRAEAETRQSKVATLKSQISRIEVKLEHLYDDRLVERISVEAYDKKSKELKEERNALQAELQRLQAVGDETKELRVEIYNLSQAAPEIFKDAPPEKRRTLIGVVFDKLEMVNGKLVYTFKEPFAALEKAAKETNSSKMPKLLQSPMGILELVENGSTKGHKSSFDLETNALLRG